MDTPLDSEALDQLFLRTVWIFQAIAAGPTFVILGGAAIINLLHTYDAICDFVTHLVTALLAAGVIFIVLVQRKISPEKTSKRLTLKFEVAKSVLATVLWIWLLLDAIFGPSNHYSSVYRVVRIKASVVASLLLL